MTIFNYAKFHIRKCIFRTILKWASVLWPRVDVMGLEKLTGVDAVANVLSVSTPYSSVAALLQRDPVVGEQGVVQSRKYHGVVVVGQRVQVVEVPVLEHSQVFARVHLVA